MEKKNTVITITEGENGITLNVENAYSPSHAIFLLTQGIQSIILKEQENEQGEDVPELPTADEQEEKFTMSEV